MTNTTTRRTRVKKKKSVDGLIYNYKKVIPSPPPLRLRASKCNIT